MNNSRFQGLSRGLNRISHPEITGYDLRSGDCIGAGPELLQMAAADDGGLGAQARRVGHGDGIVGIMILMGTVARRCGGALHGVSFRNVEKKCTIPMFRFGDLERT